jgi:hypothetical protein
MLEPGEMAMRAETSTYGALFGGISTKSVDNKVINFDMRHHNG